MKKELISFAVGAGVVVCIWAGTAGVVLDCRIIVPGAEMPQKA